MHKYFTPDEIAAAAENGVSRKCLFERIYKMHWERDRAISTPPRERKPTGYYADWLARAAANGINPSTFYNRIHARGWSPERAATESTISYSESGRLGGRRQKA